MKTLIHSLLTGVLSLVTTCIIMAAPIAAVIYASDVSQPVAVVESLSLAGEKTATVTSADEDELTVTDKKAEESPDKAAAGEHRENRRALSGLTLAK